MATINYFDSNIGKKMTYFFKRKAIEKMQLIFMLSVAFLFIGKCNRN